MNAATAFDLGPLTWVKGEIDLALQRAEEALGQYESSADATLLKFCRTHVHQVYGALSIVGQPNQPLRLLPLYQALAKARGQAMIHASDLFYPDLSWRPARRAAVDSLSAEQLKQVVKTARMGYQKGLLQLLRNPAEAERGRQTMRDALASIE